MSFGISLTIIPTTATVPRNVVPENRELNKIFEDHFIARTINASSEKNPKSEEP